MTDAAILDALVARDLGKGARFGVTVDLLTSWRGKPVTRADVANLTEKEARRIYEVRYLNPLAEAPEELKPHLVDIAVEMGVSRARDLWKAASQQTARPVAVQLAIERVKFYGQAVKRDPSHCSALPDRLDRALAFL